MLTCKAEAGRAQKSERLKTETKNTKNAASKFGWAEPFNNNNNNNNMHRKNVCIGLARTVHGISAYVHTRRIKVYEAVNHRNTRNLLEKAKSNIRPYICL